MQLTPELVALADEQSGVLSQKQMMAGGVTKSALAHAVRIGRWQRLLPRTYLTHSGPEPAGASLWAAVLYAGAGAVLSHTTAAGFHGWRTDDEDIHVTVPARRSVARKDGLVIHRSPVDAAEVVTRDGLPVTKPLRTTLDLLSLAETGEHALNVVARAVQRAQVDPEVLGKRIDAGRLRWRQIVLPALHDIAAGSHSGLEVRFAQILRDHGVRLGRRQAAFGATRVDMAYAAVIVELDGQLGHSEAGDRFRDMDRDNAHALGGRTVLRFGWHDVQTRSCAVAALVARALGDEAAACGINCAA